MLRRERQGTRVEKSPLFFELLPADLTETAKKNVEEFTKVQANLFGECQQMGRRWLDRAAAEANLASELASKLTASRSIPDAMTACQQWGAQRLQMMAEDTIHLFDDTQTFLQSGARFWRQGEPKQTGTSTT
jgi:hypothetical protein